MSTTESPENNNSSPLLGLGSSAGLGQTAWTGPSLWTAQNTTWLHEQARSRQQVYVHKKTGGIYGVVCNATRESDGELLVVYRNIETGDRWARPASEFNDGRFERVA